VALGQEADSALSELRFGDIVRSYGPEASFALFTEELMRCSERAFCRSTRSQGVFKSIFERIG
jgi:hypothetical protein